MVLKNNQNVLRKDLQNSKEENEFKNVQTLSETPSNLSTLRKAILSGVLGVAITLKALSGCGGAEIYYLEGCNCPVEDVGRRSKDIRLIHSDAKSAADNDEVENKDGDIEIVDSNETERGDDALSMEDVNLMDSEDGGLNKDIRIDDANGEDVNNQGDASSDDSSLVVNDGGTKDSEDRDGSVQDVQEDGKVPDASSIDVSNIEDTQACKPEENIIEINGGKKFLEFSNSDEVNIITSMNYDKYYLIKHIKKCENGEQKEESHVIGERYLFYKNVFFNDSVRCIPANKKYNIYGIDLLGINYALLYSDSKSLYLAQNLPSTKFNEACEQTKVYKVIFPFDKGPICSSNPLENLAFNVSLEETFNPNERESILYETSRFKLSLSFYGRYIDINKGVYSKLVLVWDDEHASHLDVYNRAIFKECHPQDNSKCILIKVVDSIYINDGTTKESKIIIAPLGDILKISNGDNIEVVTFDSNKVPSLGSANINVSYVMEGDELCELKILYK